MAVLVTRQEQVVSVAQDVRQIRVDDMECLTMEKSLYLLGHLKRGELILVPLQQAHLLPATHKSSSQRTDGRSHHVLSATGGLADAVEAWLTWLTGRKTGCCGSQKVVQDVKYIRLSSGLCLAKFHLPHIHAGNPCRQGIAAHAHPARRLLHV